MKQSEIAQVIASYHNVLMTVSVSGESALKMSDVIRGMRRLSEVLMAEPEQEVRKEREDGELPV